MRTGTLIMPERTHIHTCIKPNWAGPVFSGLHLRKLRLQIRQRFLQDSAVSRILSRLQFLRDVRYREF